MLPYNIVSIIRLSVERFIHLNFLFSCMSYLKIIRLSESRLILNSSVQKVTSDILIIKMAVVRMT